MNTADGGSGSGRKSFAASELDYGLPERLIAQTPPDQRGDSRLLVVDRASGTLTDRHINDLAAHLAPGDTVVFNNTRVLPAKFELQRATGGRIEGLFLNCDAEGCWNVLLKGAGRVNVGESLAFVGSGDNDVAETVARGERGHWLLKVDSGSPSEVLGRVGRMPLPPYIKRARDHDQRDPADRDRYQTVFAAQDGAVAAPTAGLHFTSESLVALGGSVRGIEYVTLHVGYGTFAPLEVEDLADHDMHTEEYAFSGDTAEALRVCRADGGRVVAVGTTSARVLETAWLQDRWSGPTSGQTGLFCYPPYCFGGVDVLLTNFHLPRSTLLALVMAFAGVDLVRRAYAHAIAEAYRFYSYGDAMLIL